MKLKKSIKTLLISSAAALAIVGCGSSDNSAPGVPLTPTTLTGTFIDAPTQGLSFQTATQNGFTDASGHFKYIAGEEVEFKLGNLSLGKAPAVALVTPYTIAENNDTATNIALLLQNFDGDRSNGGVLDLSKLKDFSFTLSDFNLSVSPATIKGKIQVLFADASFTSFRDNTNNTVLDETAVKTSMDTYIKENSTKFDKKFTQDYLDTVDFYMVDDEDGAQRMRFRGSERQVVGDGDSSATGGFNANFDTPADFYTTSGKLIDGNLEINFGQASNTLTVLSQITSITDDAIYVTSKVTKSTIASLPVGLTKNETWYTNKNAAIKNTITTQFGFGEEAIKGKDFYVFFEDAASYKQFNVHFSDTTQSFTFNNLLEGGSVENQYTIDNNGSINWTEDNGINQFNVLSTTGTYIVVHAQTTLAERVTDPLGNLNMYFTKEDMLTAYNNR